MPEMTIEAIAQRNAALTNILLDEIKHGASEYKYYREYYFKVFEKINYLSFLIVGAVLALNKNLQSNVIVLTGCILIIGNAVYAYFLILSGPIPRGLPRFLSTVKV